jgi:hypothetical protein
MGMPVSDALPRACASVFKRGMVGDCQHCGEAHLHCYLASCRVVLRFTDKMRVDAIMEGIEGKRLTYRSKH